MATNYNDYMTQIAQSRQDVGQRIAGLPQFQTDLSTAVYGADKSLPSLRGQVGDKIQALYDVDKRAAERYSSPESNMFIRNPYEREKLMGQQHQAEMGSIGGLQEMIAKRQDVLGSAMGKGLDIYKAGIDAQKFEYQSLMDELNMSMKIDAAKRAGASKRSTTPTYSQIVTQANKFAPQNDGAQVGETGVGGGFNFTWDGQAWTPTSFGAVGLSDEMLSLAMMNPEFDQKLGASVYEQLSMPAKDDTSQWQSDEQRQAALSEAVQQAFDETPDMDAEQMFQNIIRVYGDQIPTEDYQGLKEAIYTRKGQIFVGSF